MNAYYDEDIIGTNHPCNACSFNYSLCPDKAINALISGILNKCLGISNTNSSVTIFSGGLQIGTYPFTASK